MSTAPPSLEAKLVVLGSQGVGKTSLVHRYVKSAFLPPSKSQSTVGASFVTTRVADPESGATLRLQIWDTAGQERFRSISKLYYRGAHAAILCYDVTSRQSFEDMGRWLRELREQTGAAGGGQGDMVVHVVGTKADVVAAQPALRQVSFERCINYIAEQLYPGSATSTAPVTPGLGMGMAPQNMSSGTASGLSVPVPAIASPNSNRSSGFWGHEALWDCCHEVSAKDGEGIEEVFRVITRKLVEQHHKRMEYIKFVEGLQARGRTPATADGAGMQAMGGYFDLPSRDSIRLGHGDKRKSWLGITTPGGLTSYGGDDGLDEVEDLEGKRGRCC